MFTSTRGDSFFYSSFRKDVILNKKKLLVFIAFYLICDSIAFYLIYDSRVQALKTTEGLMAYKFTVLQYESTVSAPTSYDLITDAKGSVDMNLILDH